MLGVHSQTNINYFQEIWIRSIENHLRHWSKRIQPKLEQNGDRSLGESLNFQLPKGVNHPVFC